MGDIYESSIPTKCIEDCKDGLIFADPIKFRAQAYVFSCCCIRGRAHKHYPVWHPVRSKQEYSRSKEEVSITPPPVLEDIADSTIPQVIKDYFDTDHICVAPYRDELWELHKETYGRAKLAQWYKQWKMKPQAPV